MGKVALSDRFLDISDYGRPLAHFLVHKIIDTPISPIHITLLYTLVGFVAAYFIMIDTWLGFAGILLILKSILDAMDGALARARNRPSRVGRFLDSDCDFVVSAAIFASIAWREARLIHPEFVWISSSLAFLSILIQGSIYNYYSIRYRNQTQGDRTSHLREESPDGYSWDNPHVLKALYRTYLIFYSWQDSFISFLDHKSRLNHFSLKPVFLTIISVMGLGSQLLIISFCLFLGKPFWAIWIFIFVFNFYALLIFWLGPRYLRSSSFMKTENFPKGI